MDSSNRCLPRVIPDAILNVLCLLEDDKHQFQWKLSRNTDGISLVISTHSVNKGHKGYRAPRSPDLETTSAGSVLDRDTAKTTPASVRSKKKSPSTIRRNRKRRDLYRQRKKAARLRTRNSADAVIPVVSEQSCDSQHTDKQPPISTTDHSTDCSDLEDCVNISTAQTIDSDDESDIVTEDRCNICANCSKTFETELKKCSRCHVFRYCSKECQILDWPRHKSVCNLIADSGM